MYKRLDLELLNSNAFDELVEACIAHHHHNIQIVLYFGPLPPVLS